MSQLGSSLMSIVDVFKGARLFPPHKVNTMLLTASEIDSIPRLNDLKSELPSYIARATDLSPEICPFIGGKLMPQPFLTDQLLPP